MDVTTKEAVPSGLRTITSSPSVMRNNAFAIGESILIKPLSASNSSGPTIRYRYTFPSESSISTHAPKKTLKVSQAGLITIACRKKSPSHIFHEILNHFQVHLCTPFIFQIKIGRKNISPSPSYCSASNIISSLSFFIINKMLLTGF